MPLIKAKDAVDVFVNEGGNITICHPDDKDALVVIHREDVDTVINAIKQAASDIDDHFKDADNK